MTYPWMSMAELTERFLESLTGPPLRRAELEVEDCEERVFKMSRVVEVNPDEPIYREKLAKAQRDLQEARVWLAEERAKDSDS